MHLLRYVFMGFSRIRERTMFIGEKRLKTILQLNNEIITATCYVFSHFFYSMHLMSNYNLMENDPQ